MTASAKRAPYSEVGKPAELRWYRVVRGAGAYLNATSACQVARSTAFSSVCAEGQNSFRRSPCLLNLLKTVLISVGVTREDRESLAFLRDVLNVLGLPDPPIAPPRGSSAATEIKIEEQESEWGRGEEIRSQIEERFGLFPDAPLAREAAFRKMWRDEKSGSWILDYHFSK
jgi:hypothetical protein